MPVTCSMADRSCSGVMDLYPANSMVKMAVPEVRILILVE